MQTCNTLNPYFEPEKEYTCLVLRSAIDLKMDRYMFKYVL